jgi:hypothetical protein
VGAGLTVARIDAQTPRACWRPDEVASMVRTLAGQTIHVNGGAFTNGDAE